MHGELGYLKEARGLGQKIGAACIRLAFQLLNQNNVTLAAISLPIGTNLRNLYPKLKNIEIFEHPPHIEEDSVSHLVRAEGGGKSACLECCRLIKTPSRFMNLPRALIGICSLEILNYTQSVCLTEALSLGNLPMLNIYSLVDLESIIFLGKFFQLNVKS